MSSFACPKEMLRCAQHDKQKASCESGTDGDKKEKDYFLLILSAQEYTVNFPSLQKAMSVMPSSFEKSTASDEGAETAARNAMPPTKHLLTIS